MEKSEIDSFEEINRRGNYRFNVDIFLETKILKSFIHGEYIETMRQVQTYKY